MPIKKPATKTAKPKGRKLSDLNLPMSGGKPGMVGDAEKIKVNDLFDGDFKLNKPATHYSSAFDILNGDHSEYQGKASCVFLIKSRDDGENYWFFIAANDTRQAIVDAFAESDEPVLNVRFHKIQGSDPSHQPFLAIEDAEGEDSEEPF